MIYCLLLLLTCCCDTSKSENVEQKTGTLSKATHRKEVNILERLENEKKEKYKYQPSREKPIQDYKTKESTKEFYDRVQKEQQSCGDGTFWNPYRYGKDAFGSEGSKNLS